MSIYCILEIVGLLIMRIVLHICCGVCAAGVVERLLAEGHQVRGFFYNPNIQPAREYNRRLETAGKVAGEMGFPLEAGPYKPEEWFKAISSLENEPEGGRRCEVCFRFRLIETLQYTQKCGWDVFTTTLTISPRKSAVVVNKVGKEIGGDRFLAKDFKKQDGFNRTIKLAGKWDLYRQHYCGCVYCQRNGNEARHDCV